MKIVVVGAGAAAESYLKMLEQTDKTAAGIASRSDEKGRRVASRYRVPYFSSYSDMLLTVMPDIVIITTPTRNHLEAVRTAADNNIKHIFCEKPLGMNITEVKEIEKLCSRNGINLGVGYKMRYESIFSKAKQIYDEGKIGELSALNFSYFQSTPDRSWYLDTGVIREILSHVIDLSNWFTGGEIESVHCLRKNYLGGAAEDRAQLSILYTRGTISVIQGGWLNEFPEMPGKKTINFQIFGTKGYLSGIRPDILFLYNNEGFTSKEIIPIDPIRDEFENFLESIETRSPAVSIEDALKVHSIIMKAYSS